MKCTDCEYRSFDDARREGNARRVTNLSFLRAEGWEHSSEHECLMRKCALHDRVRLTQQMREGVNPEQQKMLEELRQHQPPPIGWLCIRCGRSYSPSTSGCAACNRQEAPP